VVAAVAQAVAVRRAVVLVDQAVAAVAAVVVSAAAVVNRPLQPDVLSQLQQPAQPRELRESGG
jgi:hypothetical protein